VSIAQFPELGEVTYRNKESDKMSLTNIFVLGKRTGECFESRIAFSFILNFNNSQETMLLKEEALLRA
jgi:hypothetical protein